MIQKIKTYFSSYQRKTILIIVSLILAIIAQFFLYRSSTGYEIFINSWEVSFIAPNNEPNLVYIGLGLYIIATILFLFGVYKTNINEYFSTLSFFSDKESQSSKPRRKLGATFLIFSVILITTLYFLISNYQHWLIIIWLFSILLGGVGIIFIDGKKPDLSVLKLDKHEIIFLILLIIFCLIVLLPYLDYLPFFVETDEGNNGLIAREFFSKDKINFWENISGAWPVPSFYLSFLFLNIVGNNLFGLRMASVTIGILSLLVLYFGVRAAFNREVAAISTIIAASANIFIAFARPGYNNIQSIFILALIFTVLMMFFKTNNYIYAFIAGLATGLGNYFYLSLRVMIFAMILYLFLLVILHRKHWKSILKAFICFIFGYFLVIAPYLFTSLMNPNPALSRASEIFYLASKQSFDHMAEVSHTNNPILIVLRCIVRSLEVFNYIPGETSTAYQNGRPFLDYISGILFIFGFFTILFKLKDARYLFLITTFGIILSISSLTMDAPCIHRLIMYVPILSLICAVTIFLISQQLKNLLNNEKDTKNLSKGFIIITLILIVLANFEIYFYKFITHNSRNSMFDKKTMVARIINKYSPSYDIYFAYNNLVDDFQKNSSIINVIEPAGMFLINNKSYEKILNIPERRLPFKNKVDKDVIILIDPDFIIPINTFISFYKVDYELIKNNNNEKLFVIFKLPKELINSKIKASNN